ncbi:MAG TPA: adenosylcobinamide-phosphate synthase CbiB [Bordetella sp.]
MPWRDGAHPWAFVLAVGLALLVDIALGEPPAAWHPVVWMGRYLEAAGRRFAPARETPRGRPDVRAFARGTFYWCAGAALTLVLAAVLQAVLLAAPAWLAVAGLALLLKPMLAWAMLRREVQAVELALADSLPAGRERLSRLCSRDVSGLSAEQVRETAIESLAENLNDSVVAPVFWFVLLGLPGAAVYRYANTADAMWGYLGMRGGRDWTWAGKWAARADDALSWLPARITAALLALAAGGMPARRLRREAGRTPSPNSGWPMAAMALALGVHLRKPGVYVLNQDGADPQHADTARAIRLAGRCVLALPVLAALAAWPGGMAA